MKKCCVLIPYYNAGDTLLSAINSIDYDYLYPDVIIVDDGSQITKAADVLKKYIGPLNIILLEMDKNFTCLLNLLFLHKSPQSSLAISS